MGHLDKDRKGDSKDVGKILQSYPVSPACDSCLLHPSVPDSPSPRTRVYPIHYEPLSLTSKFRHDSWDGSLSYCLCSATQWLVHFRAFSPHSPCSVCVSAERESMQGSTLTFGKGRACALVFIIITEICFCLPFLWIHENSYLNTVLICTKKHFQVVLISLYLAFYIMNTSSTIFRQK